MVLLYCIDTKSYKVAIVDGSGEYDITNLCDGNHDITAEFIGDNRYMGCVSKVKQLEVNKINTKLSIKIDQTSMSYNDTSIVSVSLLNQNGDVLKINAIVTVKVNGNNNTVGLVGGEGKFTLRGLNKDNYTITAVFAGDDRYLQSTSNNVYLNVTGDNITTTTTISIDKPSIFVGDKAIIKVKLNKTADGVVTVNVNGTEYIIGIDEGQGSLILSDLTEGIYKINATFAGDNKYNGSSSNVKQLIVNKAPTSLTINIDKPSIFVGDKAIVSVVLNQTANGVVTVNVNGDDYIIGIFNGKGNLTLTNLNNSIHNINAVFAGDDKYLGSTSNNVILGVNQINTNIDIIVDSPIFEGNDAKITINMNPTINGIVKLNVGDKSYNVAIVNGVGTYTVSNLAKGIYNVNAVFASDDKYSTSKSNVKELIINKVPTNPSTEKATFTQTKAPKTISKKAKKLVLSTKLKIGKKIAKKRTVTFIIKGKKYTRKTNNKGVAKLTLKKKQLSAILKNKKSGQKIKYKLKYGKNNNNKYLKVNK